MLNLLETYLTRNIDTFQSLTLSPFQDIDNFLKILASLDLRDCHVFLQAIHQQDADATPQHFLIKSEVSKQLFGQLTWGGKLAAINVIKEVTANKD